MIAEAQGNLLFGYFLGIRDSSRSRSFGKKHLDPPPQSPKSGITVPYKIFTPLQALF